MSTIETTLPPLFDVPAGWEWTTLGEIGTWAGGGTPKKGTPEYWDGGTVPWISPKDMKQPVLTDSLDHITEQATTETSAKLRAAHSVAFVTRSGILEHSLPVAYVPVEAAYNQDMKVLTPDEDIDARFVALYCRAYAHEILNGCRKDGTTVASIDLAKLTAFPCPKPSLAQQHDVVAKADSLLASVSAGQEQLVATRRLIGALRTAVLNDAFADLDAIELGEIAEVFVGATPSRADASLWDGTVPWVSSGEVAFRRIDQTREGISMSAIGSSSKRIHPPGTVLVAMIGEGKTRGQAAVLDVAAAHNQNCASIRLDPDRMLPEYLYYWFMARYHQNRSGGAGSQQPALNGQLVRALKVPCPSLADQQSAIARIETIFAFAESTASQVDDAARWADAFVTAIRRSSSSGRIAHV